MKSAASNSHQKAEKPSNKVTAPKGVRKQKNSRKNPPAEVNPSSRKTARKQQARLAALLVSKGLPSCQELYKHLTSTTSSPSPALPPESRVQSQGSLPEDRQPPSTPEKKLRGKTLPSTKGESKAISRRRLRPNEIPDRITDYKQRRPQHTAKDWIEEALYASGQHCEDHDLEVSTFLYCALDALRSTTSKSKRGGAR